MERIPARRLYRKPPRDIRVAASAYERHDADNDRRRSQPLWRHGAHGRMLPWLRTPFKKVTVPRKVVRAEPISALYEQGRSGTSGSLPGIEDELSAFSTVGYSIALQPSRRSNLGAVGTVPALSKARSSESPSNWMNSAIRSCAVLVQWDGWHEARPTLCWPGDMRGRNPQPRRPASSRRTARGVIHRGACRVSRAGYGRQLMMR